MFGAGWTEMLIIGIVALVVIGPKDLPIVMRKIGRIVGTVRRMGGEFQREINKTTGLDQISDLRRSITEPLRQTSDEIAKEFNRQTSTGVEPSGVIKPADPAVESVYDQITASAGLPSAEALAPPPVMKPLASSEVSPAPAEATAVAVKSPRPRRAAKAADAAHPGKSSPAKQTADQAPAKVKSARSPRPSAPPIAPMTAPAPAEAIPLAPQPEAVPAKSVATSRRKPAAKSATAGSAAKTAMPRARTKKA